MTRIGLRLGLLFMVQAMILFALVLRQVHTVATGQVVSLVTVPVPALSLYRGGEVPLRYPFSSVPIDMLPGDQPPRPGQRLWVVLTSHEDGKPGPWRVERVEEAPPDVTLEADRLVLRGYVRAAPEGGGTVVCPVLGGPCKVWLDYGLERFPIPAAQATRWEDWRKGERLTVLARVDDTGNAVLTGMILGEQLVRRDPLDWLHGDEAGGVANP